MNIDANITMNWLETSQLSALNNPPV